MKRNFSLKNTVKLFILFEFLDTVSTFLILNTQLNVWEVNPLLRYGWGVVIFIKIVATIFVSFILQNFIKIKWIEKVVVIFSSIPFFWNILVFVVEVYYG